MSYRERVLKALEEGRIIYYDSEYCFPKASKKTEWRYKPASLRVQVFKIGNKPLECYDVWKTGHHWDRIFDLLEQGYFFVAHNAIADIRPDLCDDRILKYAFNGQVMDTIYMERLIHGMSDPIGATEQSVEEDSDEEEQSVGKLNTPFALDSVIKRHTGTTIKKTYQDARNYLKPELSPQVLEYASNDVKYLPAIVQNQIEKIDLLDLWDVVELNHQLLATSWIIKHQGIPINMKELSKYKTELRQKASDIEQKLLEILPKVSYTDTQLIDIYFDTFWVKGKGLCGLTSKCKAKDIVKKKENHAITTVVYKWIEANRDKVTRTVNLRSSGQRLQAFKMLGYKINSTAETELRDYCSKQDAPVIESYLEWQKTNSLLTKVLDNMTYDKYLRKDNTVPSTFTWVKALNGRSSSQDMNVQQCLSGDTEVLTEEGWKRIDSLKASEKVAQYNKGVIEFTKPLRLVENVSSEMLHIKSTHINLKVTKNHRCLLRSNFKGKEKFRDVLAQNFPSTGYQHIHSGIYNSAGIDESDEFIQLLVATQADGSYLARSIEYSFSKQRKVDRLISILDKLNAVYEIKKSTVYRPDRVRIYLKDSNLVSKLREYMPNKEFKSWILSLNHQQLTTFCYETLLWDGCDLRNRSKTVKGIGEYCSTIKVNSDWVQTAWMLIGKRAKLKEVDRRAIDKKGSLSYRVYITDTDMTHIDNRQITSFKSKSYCVEVPSSYIVIRTDGCTSITGNCPRELKSLYGTPSGKVKVEYDYSAIELMKLLNDFPVNELTPLLFDDKEDIHLYNAATFFNRDYEELKVLHKQKDPTVKQLRNAAKTVIYFLQYKTPKYAEDRYVTGTNKLIEIFNNSLGWALERETAEALIITGEQILQKWTTEKTFMDKDIIKLANSDISLNSVLLSHLRDSKEDINLAINEGIIYFRGAMNMLYMFDLLRDRIYTPEKTEWDEEREEYKLRREYINNRSLYSCRIAGPVAIAAKRAVNRIQKELYDKYGYQHAWLGLFVHDSMTAYCHEDIAKDVDHIVKFNMLKEMYDCAGFSKVPVYIEGAVGDNPESKYGYFEGNIMTF